MYSFYFQLEKVAINEALPLKAAPPDVMPLPS